MGARKVVCHLLGQSDSLRNFKIHYDCKHCIYSNTEPVIVDFKLHDVRIILSRPPWLLVAINILYR